MAAETYTCGARVIEDWFAGIRWLPVAVAALAYYALGALYGLVTGGYHAAGIALVAVVLAAWH